MPTPPRISPDPVTRRLHLVVIGVLVGLFVKWEFFAAADVLYREEVIRDSFFPMALQSHTTLRIAFWTTAVVLVIALGVRARFRTITLAISVGTLTVLNLHQASYNDMTFLAAWWCVLWCTWLSSRSGIDADDDLLVKSGLIARLILSLVLLGGAAGKWTPEYWSGDVLHEIYFRDRQYWTFDWLRQTLTQDQLRLFSTAYSRGIIVLETVGGLTFWKLPPKVAAVTFAVIFISIAALSNWYLFSVTAPLIALAIASINRRVGNRPLRTAG